MADRRRRRLAATGLAAVAAAVAVGIWLTGPGSTVDSAASGSTSGPASGPTSGSAPAATSPVEGTSTDTAAPVNPVSEDPADVATDTAEPRGVSVHITYAAVDEAAGGVTIGGYVAGLLEDGGRCRLTLTQGELSLTAESEGLADVRTTTCGQLLVPTAALTTGTWAAALTYFSPDGDERGTATTFVEVP